MVMGASLWFDRPTTKITIRLYGLRNVRLAWRVKVQPPSLPIPWLISETQVKGWGRYCLTAQLLLKTEASATAEVGYYAHDQQDNENHQ
jgi:hypothetical protein